jgi:steroid 5-alpha reductase family enzyme
MEFTLPASITTRRMVAVKTSDDWAPSFYDSSVDVAKKRNRPNLVMTPLIVVLIIAGVACAFAWLASLVTGDTSWVDRSWSIVPVIYLWVFAGYAHFTNARLDVMASVVTIWGARLTFNFARRGGYSGVEDYRWAVLRARMSRWQFQIFNFFFIVIYQNVILVLITLPAYTAYENRARTPYGALDVVLAVLFVACTVGETIADQQQWNFQAVKLLSITAGRTPETQFLQTGLFRFSRHPNYFFEIAQWWILFFMGTVAAASVLQWTVLGPVLLSALFVGSTIFTEEITLSRYPEYARYQQHTSPVVPWFSRASNA